MTLGAHPAVFVPVFARLFVNVVVNLVFCYSISPGGRVFV